MAVATMDSHVRRAIDYKNRAMDMYFAIGKQTAWNETDTPPAVSVLDTQLQEIIGYKKVEQVYLVVPDESGTLEDAQSKWKIVSEANAYAENARWVYISTTIAYGQLPLVPYRQLGLYWNLVRNEGVLETNYTLLPSDVQDPGILEVIENRGVTTRNPGDREIYSVVVQL